MTKRRLLRWSELRALLQIRKPEPDRTRRLLARAHTIEDLRSIARRRVPRAVFDYVDGGAESEVSMLRARAALDRVEFHPRVLQDVEKVDTHTTILGRASNLPLVLAPTGFTRMMHHEGETAVVEAARRAGVPYALSTMGTTSIEDLARAAAGSSIWFQLYVWRDRGLSKELIARAEDAGYHALVLTIDVPVAGQRLRDVRNGLTIPPTLAPKTLADMALHPAWWFNVLTTEPLTFASISSSPSSLSSIIAGMFDPSVTIEDVDWIRQSWSGSLVVKGVMSVDDAKRVVDLGADGIVVSNHGGRQLDRSVTPLELLSQVVDAVGDRTEVFVDTGFRTGSDVVAAIGLGARACLVGRAYLYGLMAGGRRGVEHALSILATEVTRTLQLLGARTLREVDRTRVTLRP